MNYQKPNGPWSRLIAAAQQAADDRPTAAPYGFATRVAALAFEMERCGVSLVDRFALRALGIASLLAIFSVALNYHAITAPEVVTPVPAVAVASVLEYEQYSHDATLALVLDLAD